MSAHVVLRHRNVRGAPAEALDSPQTQLAVRLTGASMRIVEMGLAIAAIATAVLLGVRH